jgi:hypothetical protein
MSLVKRIELINKIEKLRGSTVICYLTSLRQNVAGIMADDQVRVFFDHLLKLGRSSKKLPKLDIFLVSNGGSGTVPWRLTALFREYADSVGVLLPYRAYSAATMLALGADEIVMHPFAEMGPIDPTVQNAFNPVGPNGQVIGIGVEDVSSYIQFVKQTVGITHEDELVEALRALTDKVHPLALGNVERFLAQSRMIATKILKTHMANANDHVIEDIVENMASRLYFHGHPINRNEARADLKLKVIDPGAQLEDAMWKLYKLYEAEFQNNIPFNPVGNLLKKGKASAPKLATAPAAAPVVPAAPSPATPPGPQAIPTPTGIPAPLAVVPPAAPLEGDFELIHTMVECTKLSSVNYSEHHFTMTPGHPQVRDDNLDHGWRHLTP